VAARPTRSLVFRAAFTLMVIIGVSVILARWISRHGTPPSLEVLFPAGELVVAVDANYPPFAAVGAEGLFGLDIDLAEALGERIGLPVRFANMGYDGLYDSLIVGQTDVIISALLMDGNRLGDVRYTRYYYDDGLVLVSSAQKDFATMEDIVGHTLAYAFGSPADAEARLWTRRIGSFETAPYELPEYALDAVRLQMVDAAMVDATSARLYLKQYPDWDADFEYVTHSLFAVAVRRDRVFEWRLINRALQTMMDEGTIDQIIERWL
jgi:ABC-type amino acid transport substrate-binding protein